jgi:hypothetical protein
MTASGLAAADLTETKPEVIDKPPMANRLLGLAIPLSLLLSGAREGFAGAA